MNAPAPNGTNMGSHPPLVKICGVRSVAAARAAAGAGTDLLGFNFAPMSRRRIDPAVANEAIEAARREAPSPLGPQGSRRQRGDHEGERGNGGPPQTLLPEVTGNRGPRLPSPLVVAPLSTGTPGLGERGPAIAGIFVNQPLAEVAGISREHRLDYLQLSGHETPEYCRALAEETGLPVIKAVRLARSDEAALLEAYTRDGGVTLLLADAAVSGAWGGSGQPWDWHTAAGLATRTRLLLAGGLTPQNVASAIAAVQPFGVDVASRVETDGQTDPDKVRAFIKSVKSIPIVPLSP